MKCIHGVSVRKPCAACHADTFNVSKAIPPAVAEFVVAEREVLLAQSNHFDLGTFVDYVYGLREQRDAQLVALKLCVASLDQLLPYLGTVPADVGLLNQALMAARPLIADKQHPE